MTKQLCTVEKLDTSSSTKRKSKISKRTEKLDDLLLNTVDETIKYVFKETGAKVIYNYLGNKYHLKREDVFYKPNVFSTSLNRLLTSGAPVIEKMILQNLYSKAFVKI